MVVVSDIAVTDVVLCVELPVGAPLSCEASASHITNAACTFTIVFQILSGKGPDRVSFHSNSICRSLVSHCATVLSDMAAAVSGFDQDLLCRLCCSHK